MDRKAVAWNGGAGLIGFPSVRGECEDVLRPCPGVRCYHHMLWALLPGMRNKSMDQLIRFFFKQNPDDDVIFEMLGKLGESCVLDMVDKYGEGTLQQIGDVLNVTRERVRQIEYNHKKGRGALVRLRHPSRARFLEEFKGVRFVAEVASISINFEWLP